MGSDFAYTGGGVSARGYYAEPATRDIRGAVLVFPEAPGVGGHVRRRVDALAAAGYAALGADLHGRGRLAEGHDEARRWVEALKADPATLIARMEAALATLVARCGVDDRRVALAGYCFGGWCALELARSGAAAGSVTSFHGSVASARGVDGLIGRSVLVCTGDADPFVPADQLAAFGAAVRGVPVDYQLCVYGGVGHGFTDRDAPTMPGFAYDAAADRRSWRSFLHLLDDQMTAADVRTTQ
ncbi:dienelactone hydrolase family protein [Sphingomonas sp. 2SG]|uniref:dienelactone hydrolase family protein n=1 Tax=Sphingomonas sp. 2SG TaxID=2502201 RepID=UPI0010F526AA|nr:dienelactone hydrolase family protein [Sphingomonas sp. 2SG]